MRVGINGYYLNDPRCGIGRYTESILRSVSHLPSTSDIHQPDLVTFVPDELCSESRSRLPSQVEVVPVPLAEMSHRYAQREEWESRALVGPVSRAGLDLYHSPYSTLPSKRSTCPTVVTMHDTIPWHVPSQRCDPDQTRYVERAAGEAIGADRLLTVSECSKADLVATLGVPPWKLEVLYQPTAPCFDEVPSQEATKAILRRLSLTRPFFLAPSGLKRHKNVETAIAAYSRLLQTSAAAVDYELVVIGSSQRSVATSASHYYSEQDLRDAAGSIGQAGLRLLGSVSDFELNVLYRNAAASLCLSLKEGLGLTVLEAIKTGCPVIASNIPAHREVAAGRAEFVPPLGAAIISSAMEKWLHGSPGGSSREGELPNSIPFTDSAFGSGLYALYCDLVAGKGQAA